jgi:hypothetical protein
MRSIFGLNYFVFCITALVLILYCTKDMRDEGFEFAGTMTQLASTRAPSGGCVKEYYMDPGVIDQMVADEGFDNTGALINLATTRVGEGFDNSGALMQLAADEPFAGFDTFPQLEYSTKVNKVGRKVDKQIYDDLTTQGIINMTESKYVPYHCPKSLME